MLMARKAGGHEGAESSLMLMESTAPEQQAGNGEDFWSDGFDDEFSLSGAR